ncbi:MAG TPA: hypothetical protein VG413_03565 [Candidatus Dormibacteraeota bacterium]|jgi:hypothetical protein|nr:hypothetical protein [Candidatus Dormibacteraeota bacterium]
MSDDFEKNLRDHLHREAEETREFPRRLRGRIRDGIAPRTRAGMVPQLALAGALVLVAVAVLAFRNPTIITVVTTGIKGIIAPSPTPTPQPFLCQDQSGGSSGVTATLTNIRPGSHAGDGYDRVVFDFNGGIPSWDLTRQQSPTFTRDASGQPVTLDGSAGLKLVLRGADVASGVASDLTPRYTSIREVAQLGNFEHQLTYGIGLSSSQCVRVLQLSNSRLVVDVATSGSASTTAAPTPLPTQPAATDSGAFACVDHSGGTNSGPAMQLTAVRVAHQTGFDRIVFEFAPPAGATAHIPAYTVSRQASAKFVKDPSGLPVTMRGSSGLHIVFHGASGASSYNGSRDQVVNLPVVQEVEQLGDFEAVLSWGAGLSQASCIRTLELSNPTRLVVDVQTP